MPTLELLAPAKNLKCGIAAIDHGADAVYIGAPRFGARASAGNSLEDISTLCDYAHNYGAKVFVTVNTIVYDHEINDILLLVHELDEIGVDALLIQDMGLMSLLHKEKLRCQLHASTQTDNRSAEKVAWLASLGFRRIVLARELSIDEIAAIHKEVPEVQLEVFVHGALCVSYSGQCYASQHCFGRSANRGECAQFCRLPFELTDADGQSFGNSLHLLSLKDMAQIENIEALAQAGAISFKIEGRLKDVDYVKNITAAYSEELNKLVRKHPDLYRRSSYGHCRYTFIPNINKSFNRGFTSYFANGRDKHMTSPYTPKSMGEYVGKVKEVRGNSFNIACSTSFANGDGLCFLDSHKNLIGFRVNKVEGNRIFPFRMPGSLKAGTVLYRNLDQAFTSILSKPSAERKIRLSLNISTKEDNITLTGEDECGRHACVSHKCELEEAQKSQEENIKKQLSKMGGSIFECTSIEVLTNKFIPSSILASMRRSIVDELQGKNIDCDVFTNFTKDECIPPEYDIPYLYNASNKNAKDFYEDMGIKAEAFENKAATGPLMQCRYCLRHELGYCSKQVKRTPWREPLFITMSDGRSFRLQFDCKNCQMNIFAHESREK